MVYQIRVTFKQKRMLDLLIKEGLTQTQIAQRLGCSPSNIAQTLSRLKQKYPKLKVSVYKKTYSMYDVPENYVKNE